jgi:hypothetical protein
MMRYLRATLVGLLVGFVVTVAMTAFELLLAQRKLAESMQCADGVCDSYVQFGHVRYLGIAFVLGFAPAFTWFLRRPRRSSAGE